MLLHHFRAVEVRDVLCNLTMTRYTAIQEPSESVGILAENLGTIVVPSNSLIALLDRGRGARQGLSELNSGGAALV